MRPCPRNNASPTGFSGPAAELTNCARLLDVIPFRALQYETRPWPKLSQHDLTRISASIRRPPTAPGAGAGRGRWRHSHRRLRGPGGDRAGLARLRAAGRWHRFSKFRLAGDLAAPYRRAQRREARHRGRRATRRGLFFSCSRCRSARPALCANSPGSAASFAITTRRCWRRISPRGSTPSASWRCGETLRVACKRNPRLRYDFIDLEKMPETVGAQPNPMRHLGGTMTPSGAYLTHLTGDWETFYTAKRSSATRRRDRTKRKRLGEFGELKFVNPASDGDILQRARHADGAEGAIVCPHGRRQSVRQAGLCGILSRARHRSGDPAVSCM